MSPSGGRPRAAPASVPAVAASLLLAACTIDVPLGLPFDVEPGAPNPEPAAEPPSPCLSTDPTLLDLGPVGAGGTGAGTVHVRNACDAAIPLTGVLLTGSRGFAVAAGAALVPAIPAASRRVVDLPEPTVVPGGGSVPFSVSYAPEDPFEATARLVFVAGGTGGTDAAADPEVDLLANAGDPWPCAASFPKEVVSFGGVPWGESSTPRAVYVSNCGPGPLSLLGWSVAGDPTGSFAVEAAETRVVPPGSKIPDPASPSPLDIAPILVTYTPASVSPLGPGGEAVPHEATLEIATDTFDGILRLALTGTGVGDPCAQAVLGPLPSEVPPGTVVALDGAGSVGTQGAEIVAYHWSVAEEPEGSHALLLPDAGAPSPTVRLGVAGAYLLRLEVEDAYGLEACSPAEHEIEVVTGPGLHVELTWTTDGDADPADVGLDAGTDLDLHVLHPHAVGMDVDGDEAPDGWFDKPFDVFWSNAAPAWPNDPAPPAGEGADPPPSAVHGPYDDRDGTGPEYVHVPVPEAGRVFCAGVHFWSDHGFGPSTARVRFFLDGLLLAPPVSRELFDGQLWSVACAGVPGGDISPGKGVVETLPLAGGKPP